MQIDNWTSAVADLERSGRAYVLITLLGARGSTPRDSGTKMVVSEETTYGSIGGGHLEFKTLEIAARLLRQGESAQHIEHFPLGAKLGQCCGGSTTVLFESFAGNHFNIMLFGAGHVGKALAGILAQMPCSLHWVDSRSELFPAGPLASIMPILSDEPQGEVINMPPGAYYLIMTHNHQLDYAILETVLKRGDAAYVGLIGSATKWRRFKLRLAHRGFPESVQERVHCPIGLSEVPGKRPIEVAVSVAGEIIANFHAEDGEQATQRGIAWRDLQALTVDADAGTEPR